MLRFRAAVCHGMLLVFSSVSLAGTTPEVWAQVHRNTELGLAGNAIQDLPYMVVPDWIVSLYNSTGEVTSPRFELTCDQTFDDIRPVPYTFTPPATYTWDYPGQTLVGQQDVMLHESSVLLDQTGFVCTRSVDQPLLTGDTTVQNMTFTLRFTRPLPAGINDVNVNLAGRWDDFGVTEAVLDGSAPLGWTSTGIQSGAWWRFDPNNVVVGHDYVFTVQIQSTRPAGETRTIYHVPWAYMGYSEVSRQSSFGTTGVTVSHPQGATANLSVAEVADWHTDTFSRMRNSSLQAVSIPLDGTDLTAPSAVVRLGNMYDRSGSFLGSSLSANADGVNLVAAELTCPDGRTWSLRHDDEGGFSLDLEGSSATMTILSAVQGSYQVAVHGPTGQTLTVPIDLSWMPDAPSLILPSEGQIVPPTGYLFQWEALADPTLDGCNLYLESGDWEWEQMMPPGQTSIWVEDMPEASKVVGDFAVGFIASGTTTEGVGWQAIRYSSQEVMLITALFGDANLDGSVDLSDLSILAGNYRQTTGMNWSLADFNGNGAVDLSDLALLAGNYRQSVGTPPGEPVPEPTSLVLLALAAGGSVLRRRRG